LVKWDRTQFLESIGFISKGQHNEAYH
jgi:hypothetical protein